MNEHDAKLLAAALEIGQWKTQDPEARHQLELLGHDPEMFSSIADASTGSFVRVALTMTGSFSSLNLEQIQVVFALAATCWEIGVLTAEVAYGSKDLPDAES